MNLFAYINPLDRAAALVGVVHRPVGERGSSILDVGAFADVAWVLAADKPGIVSGQNISHQTQRDVLNLLGHAAVAENGLTLRRRLNLSQEKINPTG